MQGNTAYFFQSLFMGFTMLGMFFLGTLLCVKLKKVESLVLDERSVNVWIFTAILVVLVGLLSAYGFGRVYE